MSGSTQFFKRTMGLALAALASFATVSAHAQGIDSDLAKDAGQTYSEPYPDPESGTAPDAMPQSPAAEAPAVFRNGTPVDGDLQTDAAPSAAPAGDPSAAASAAAAEPGKAATQGTYKENDVLAAAEGVFGKGAEGLARMIQTWLHKQGEPNAYIVGREGGGAVVFGLRYGAGTLYHKVEGEKPVYWTGPSVGFDVGANAGNTFVLVYNLYDAEDLYKRFPAGEGQAYVVGGFTASYMRAGDVVLIPIRMGAGLRLGVNAGYMKFSKKQKWIPF